MLTLKEINAIGEELENTFLLKSAPLAIKLINEDEIPPSCQQPSKEGTHYALCQALAFSRHTRHPLAMFAEDHWCLWPVINFHLRELEEQDISYLGRTYFIRDPEVSIQHFRDEYPYINDDKKKAGMAIAPLATCDFIPDCVMVYCEPGQLRQMLMASKYHSGKITTSAFDTCDSCGAALVPVLNGEKDYNVSIPDAGEYERSLCGENEMIYTISGQRLEDFIGAVRDLISKGFSYKQLAYDIKSDYACPEFYNNMFKKWGLATSDNLWIPGKR